MARSRGSSAMVFDEKCGMVMVGAVNRILYLELFKHGVNFWILSYFKAFSKSLRSESRLLGATRDLGGIFQFSMN